MQVYRNATDVTLDVPLVDAQGDPLAVTAVSYRVLNEQGAEVMPFTAVGGFVAESDTATVTVAAANNTLAAGAARALRVLDLQCTVAGNVVAIQLAYSIELQDILVPGVNSFQSLAQAEFNAKVVPNIPGWDGASTEDRQAALIEARQHILMLNFRALNGRNLWGQDSLNFVPEGSFETNYASIGYIYGGDLTWLTADQFSKLPPFMLDALNRAQIVEADAILGGDPLADKRQAGVVSESIGESRVRLQNNPLQLPVCRRAAQYLSRFITFAKVAGR